MFGIGDNNRKWWILIAMGGVVGLILLDETVVGVALPTVRDELGMSQIGAHWVINAYLLVFAGFAAAGGKLADLVGLKVLFTFSVLVFGLASLASGFAVDGAWLITARAIQGLGAAVIFPASMAMVTIVFPEDERGRALGIYGAIGTVFLALGPLVGGFFTETLSWRWIFWINPPIVLIIAAIVLAAWVESRREGDRPRLDLKGLSSLVGGLALFVFAIMQGPELGWSRPIIIVGLIGGAAILVLFVLVERRIDQPLIEIDLFGNATFTSCNLVIFIAQFSKIAVIIFGALYLQEVLHMSPLVAGLALVVAVVGSPVTAAPSGRLADRLGSRRPTLIGLSVATLAVVWMGIALNWESYALLVPAFLLWGSSLTFCFMPPQRAIMNTVPVAKQGQAGGIVMTAQLLGGTIGMAACSTIFLIWGSFSAVFLTVAALMLAVLAFGYASIAQEKVSPAEPDR